MKDKQLNILIVEDNQLDAELIQYELRKFGFKFISKVIETKSRFLESIAIFNPCVILCDYSLPHFDGMTALCLRNEICPLIPFIIVTGANNEETAVECIKTGANDYVLKDNLKRLGSSIKQALKQNEILNQKKQLQYELQQREELYRQLVENQNDLISRWNKDFSIIFVNNIYAKFFGYSVQELIGTNWLELIPIEERDLIKYKNEAGFKDPKISTYTLNIVDNKGKKTWIEWTDCPLYDENGLLVGFQSIGRDITERINQQKQIESQILFINSLIESVPIPVFFKDLNFRYTGCNSLFEQFTGLSKTALIGKTVHELFEKELADFYLEKDLEIIQNEIAQTYEYIIKDKKGLNHDVIFKKDLIRNAENIIVGIIGAYFDITERKKAEELLREKEEKFRIMIENLPIPVCSYKVIEENISFLNSKFTDLFGYNIREIVNLGNWFDICFSSEIEREMIRGLWRKITEDSKFRTKINKVGFELPIICKNGNVLIVDTFFTIDNDDVYLVFNDITERKQLLKNLEDQVNKRTNELAIINKKLQYELSERKKHEDELRYSENLNSTTINAINNYIFVLDENLKVIMINDACKQYIKKNNVNVKAKIIKNSIYELFPKFDKVILGKYKEILSNCVGFSENFQIENKNKTIFFEIKVIPVIEKERVIRIVTSLHDITNLKQVEEEISINLQREKELNMLKTRFLSVISHEFKTPLASIQSGIQLIEKYRKNLSDEKIVNIFAGIYETIKYSSNMLDDISIIGKDESGKLEINFTLCNIQSICEKCINDSKAIFGPSIKIKLTINSKIDTAMLDETLMRHVLNNLLSNALKYSDVNEFVNFNVDLNKNNLLFSISDSGKGIPEEELKYIFEPFHRASNVETIKGTGLGLSIVKRCVQLHKGTIHIESNLGKGTKVIVTLPLFKK